MKSFTWFWIAPQKNDVKMRPTNASYDPTETNFSDLKYSAKVTF